MRAANRLVLVWGWRLTWFLSGWSVLTWFQFRGRNWFILCLGVENDLVSICIGIDLVFVWWCWTANRYGVLTDRCVCYVLEDHSVTVDWVAQWFILCKPTKEVRALKNTWVAQWWVRYKRTTEFKSHRSRSSVFLKYIFWNSSPHNSQTLSKTH